MPVSRLRAAGFAAILFTLAACAGGIDPPAAHAQGWPPVWDEDAPAQRHTDFSRPNFDPPRASHCRRPPTTSEVPGREQNAQFARRSDSAAKAGASMAEDRERSAMPAVTAAAPAAEAVQGSSRRPVPAGRPAWEPVTAGMVDDSSADFGEYLAYRRRSAHLPVRDRDVSERYLLEVTDERGRPVHDAEVAIQRGGVAEPIAWARTDTAGRAWIHPRAFHAQARTLGIAVRKGEGSARGVLVRGQTHAVQVRMGGAPLAQRPRLDLVFLIDATGSMGDEIAKLKASMRAVANQLATLPGQPDLCFGLVAYRDRGDAFVTRTHDFTDDLGAFQGVLGRVQAAGGGDKPEALNEALHETVHRLSWRADAARFVVLVADAAPHLDYGGPMYDIDMQAALAKGIKLFAVGASGLEPEGEYIYRQVAQYTGGRFVFLTYRDAADPGSGLGDRTVHDVKNYSVATLDALIVRLVSEEMARLPRG